VTLFLTFLALVATVDFFVGAAFFALETPAGLLLFTAVTFFGAAFALVFVTRFLAGAVVSGTEKTRGVECPVAERVPSRAIISVAKLVSAV